MSPIRAIIMIVAFALLLALVPALGVTTTFPLHVRMSYTKASGAVSVHGSTLPGTVVKSTGTYALKTTSPR